MLSTGLAKIGIKDLIYKVVTNIHKQNWGEWPSGLMRYTENQKDSGSNSTRGLTGF